MTMIRFSTKFSALLFCLPLGLCVAGTARAAADDEDEEWHETTGTKTEKSSSDESSSNKPSDKGDSDSDKAKEGETSGDKDAGDKGSGKDSEEKTTKKRKPRSSASPSGISLALLGSYGFRDPLAPGLGLRAGAHVETALPLYFGVAGEYFFGTTTVQKDLDATRDFTRRFVYLGGEAGVDVGVAADILLRPYVGLGFGLDVTKDCSQGRNCRSDSKLHVTLTPGIVGLYQLGTLFVGLDLRYLIISGASTTSGPVVSATIGLNF